MFEKKIIFFNIQYDFFMILKIIQEIVYKITF